MSCGSRPTQNDFRRFDNTGYEAALEAYNEEKAAYDEWRNSEDWEEYQEALAAAEQAEEDYENAVETLSEFEEENLIDGEFYQEAQLDYMNEVVDMVDDAAEKIEGVAGNGEAITKDLDQSALAFTRGSTYSLVGTAISNILYTRDTMKQNGIMSAYEAMQNKLIAEETGEAAMDSARMYTELASDMRQHQQSMDARNNLTNFFQGAGFLLGMGLGMGSPLGAAGGASFGTQIGSFLGSAFTR